MFGIVISHWGGHGSVSLLDSCNKFYNVIWLQLSQFFGEVANCVFVIISGYFSSSRTSINLKGIRNIVIDVKFYSILMFFITVMIGEQVFNLKTTLLALFPILFSQYWFVIPFLCICLISPWLNEIIGKLDKKTAFYFYCLQFLFILILPIIGNSSIASNITLFVFYYCLGAGLNIHKDWFKIFEDNKYLLSILAFGGAVIVCCAIDIMGTPLIFNRLIGRFSPFPLFTAVGLFYIFLQFNIYNTSINKLAISTFSVYLISENANVYPWFWKLYFDNAVYSDSPYMIPISILQCLIVFVICIMIDQVYRLIRDKIGCNLYRLS